MKPATDTKPRLLVIAGPNGAGKTTVTERGLAHEWFADPAINASRVARRVMQGGHDVPIPKIISRYFRSIAQCAVIAPWVDRLYLYDNSIDGTEAALILRAADGKITKLYQPAPEWMAPIIDILESTP